MKLIASFKNDLSPLVETAGLSTIVRVPRKVVRAFRRDERCYVAPSIRAQSRNLSILFEESKRRLDCARRDRVGLRERHYISLT